MFNQVPWLLERMGSKLLLRWLKPGHLSMLGHDVQVTCLRRTYELRPLPSQSA